MMIMAASKQFKLYKGRKTNVKIYDFQTNNVTVWKKSESEKWETDDK